MLEKVPCAKRVGVVVGRESSAGPGPALFFGSGPQSGAEQDQDEMGSRNSLVGYLFQLPVSSPLVLNSFQSGSLNWILTLAHCAGSSGMDQVNSGKQ